MSGAAATETEVAFSPGVYRMPIGEYHRAPGASKSKLDLVHKSSALVQWERDAPEDMEVEAAVDTGQALHTLLLEPERFEIEYVADFTQPKHALVTVDDLKGAMDERGIVYKASSSKGLLTKTLLDADPAAPVADALYAEWEKGINGRIVLSLPEHRKLLLMRDSVMAHPTARKMLELDGFSERAHFWIDKETGELCRCRPDREIPALRALADLKTTATIGDFSKSIDKYRYHVQDPFYSEGVKATQGYHRLIFAFIVVSSVRDRKRYPVEVHQITPGDYDAGRLAVRQDLATYAECRRTGVWDDIQTTPRPPWAVN